MTYKEVCSKYAERIMEIQDDKILIDNKIESTEYLLSEIAKQVHLPSARPQGKRLEDVLRDQREYLARLQGLKQERATLMLGGTTQITDSETGDLQKLMGL